MDEAPILDRERLTLITRGNPALAESFLNGLLEEGGELLARLRALLPAGDRIAIEDVAHTLKGMASEVGASRLRSAAAALESESEPLHWADGINGIGAALAELRSAISPSV